MIFPDGKRVHLLAKGRLVNLMFSEGHPSEVIEMSFGLQALMSEYIAKNRGSIKRDIINVPVNIDDHIFLLPK